MNQTPNIGSLAGKCTNLSTRFNDLEFGRGTITIDEGPMGVLQGDIGGSGWSLDLNLNGTINYGDPYSVRFQGKGVVGGEEWIYDYIAWLVPISSTR